MKASIKNISKIVGGVIFAALLIVGLYVGYNKFFCNQSSVTVTVFIHGTVGSTLNVFNPFHCMSDSATDETWSVKTIRKYRNHPIMRYDQILEDEGLVEFSPSISHDHAAYYLIPAYDEVVHYAEYGESINKYAMFGWSGLLSQQARKEAALKLYQQLCDYRDNIKQEYGVDPIIRIVAHSHGGNVALLLAEAENIHNRDLKLDLLFMLGTPIQVETVPLIESLMFKKIILGYSHGDSVQGSDYFSTCERMSYKRMGDLINLGAFVAKHPTYTRCDMRFVVNGDDNRITHINMWLIARSVPILDFMDPLPLVTLVPIFSSLLGEPLYCTQCEAHLNGEMGSCVASVVSCIDGATVKENRDFCDSELAGLLFKWRNMLLAEWQSDDTSRHILFNYKNARAMKDALWG